MAVKNGYRNVYVYLEGISGWKRKGNRVESIEKLPDTKLASLTPAQLAALLKKDNTTLLLDVRDNDMWMKIRADHPNMLHIRLVDLLQRLSEVPKERPIVVVDHMSLQAIVAGKLLLAKGYKILGSLQGGLINWSRSGFPITLPDAN